ncbi:MAG: flippase [Candidatus Moraniibacteriota bacterium]
MPVARKIAYNVVLNSFFKVFSTVALSLLSIRYVTAYLGQDGFGKYATVLAFFAFFSAILDLGLGPVTAREISREGADEKMILGNVLTLRLIASSLLLLIAPLSLLIFRYPPELEIGIMIAALTTLFSTASLVLNAIFQKYLAMDRVAMIEFAGKVLQLALILIIVRIDAGFLAVTATLLISLSFNAALAYFFSRHYVSFRLRLDLGYWKRFLVESLPMGATAIITFAYFKFDTILLSLLQSSADVGIYNVAYKIIENLVFFPAMVAGLILPLLSRFIYTDRARFEEIANKTFKVFILIVLPLMVGTFFLAPQIIAIVSGGSFALSVPVLRILIFALACIFFGQYFNMLLIVSNAQRKLMTALLFVAVFNIGLNLFFIPRYSYIGSAFTSVATELLVVILTSILVWRHVRFFPSLRHAEKALFSAAVMALALFFLAPVSFLLAGLIGTLLYAGCLWLTRAVSLSELQLLFSNRDSIPEPLENPTL